MEKEQIISVLEEWNFWNRDIGKQVGKNRHYTEKIEKFLKEREIITISGPRRAGKSTIMYQLMDRIARKEKIQQVLYVNFEEPSFLPFLSTDFLEQIYDAYREKINPDKKAYLFLDEIQNVEGWEKWVRSYYDKKENVKFVISGSSSKLLSSEFSSLLTGRFVNFEVFPLSFREFLDFRGFELPIKALKEDERKIKYHLNEYFEFGGFPEIALKSDSEAKTKTLEQYFESIIARDILERFKVRDVLSLKRAAVFGMTNISKEFSYNTLRKSLKISLGTAQEYATFMEQAYLLFQLQYFSYSLKEVMARNRKLYAVDSGLRNAVAKSNTQDSGRLAENLVYLHLRTLGKDIHYWKGLKEVDFIVKEKGLLAMNVSYGQNIGDREIQSLNEFKKEYPKSDLLIITKDLEQTKDGIIYVPLWKWLLEEKG
ncbi:ATP-binding protein [Candidatus Micrarchaeota archaeon]|nr:ATP-binding protein [Candidatus Micrarchaeota archaeon]